jgi:hypothetical protein
VSHAAAPLQAYTTPSASELLDAIAYLCWVQEHALHERPFQPVKVALEVAVLQVAKRRQALDGIAQCTTTAEVAGDEQHHGHGFHTRLPRGVKHRLILWSWNSPEGLHSALVMFPVH